MSGVRSATPESTRSIPELCDDAERVLDERAPHFDRHLRQILARIRRAASGLPCGDVKTRPDSSIGRASLMTGAGTWGDAVRLGKGHQRGVRK